MEKEQLKQIKNIQNEIKMLKEQINRIEPETVADSVRGSSPYFPYLEHSIRIEGIDYKGYSNRINRLQRRLQGQLEELMDITDKAYEYIEGIDDSLIRQILTYRYINGLSWTQVAAHIGGGNTADSVRMAHNRFFQGQ